MRSLRVQLAAKNYLNFTYKKNLMNQRLLLASILALNFFALNSWGSQRSMYARIDSYQASKKGIKVIEENQLYYPSYLRVKNGSQITETDFSAILIRLQDLYQPTVNKLGKKLEIIGDWEDATVNAVATRDQDFWRINVAGGIARAPQMTKDGLLIIVCHELGHHLGGAPRMALYGGWPSAEGQADYWATSKCLKKYYQKFKSDGEVLALPEKVKGECQSQFMLTEERDVCLKSISASVKFGKFLDTLNPKKPTITFDTPDSRIVKGTNINDYPRPQCRFDTLYAGALCTVNPNDLNSPESVESSNCNNPERPGFRPRCWFKP